MTDKLKAFPLPVQNTCGGGCGKSLKVAYALDRDAALAGRGLCEECAGMAETLYIPGEDTEDTGVEEDAQADSATPLVTANATINATPHAVRLAQEYGIDLHDVAADLPDGQRVGKGDVQAYLDDLPLDDLLE